MTQFLKYIVIASMFASGASLAPATAQVRARPVIAPTGPVKPVMNNQLKQLTQEELQARMKPAPRYLTPELVKAMALQKMQLQEVPDLKAAFSLTPAAPSVPERGSMSIAASVHVPNPLPPGFPGQATLRYYYFGLGTGGGWFGTVDLKIKALKGVFYAVDCLAAIDPKYAQIEYSISGADSSQSGLTTINNGHLTFIVRRSTSNGDININFHPPKFEEKKDLSGTRMVDQNVMDFWGCQISTGA